MAATRILVVEDEPITALDLKARLVGLGYDVLAIAASAEEAVARAADLRPDLVLMDIHLGGTIDGIAAAGAIYAELDIPVVYLTAYSDDETLARAMSAGPFGYLVKPFSERELRTTVEVALDRCRSARALQASERRLRLAARRLELLHEIDRAVLASRSPEAIAGGALRGILALLPCRRARITALDPDSNQVRVLADLAGEVAGSKPGECPASESAAGRLLPAGEIGAALCVPLLVEEESIGSLDLYGDGPGAFDRESLEIAQAVAGSLALAIHHVDLHEQVERRAAELEVRNAELDAFASTVAHDLRNPLGLITGFAEVLKDAWADMEAGEVQKSLEIISRTGSRMDRIIHELLVLAEVRKQDVECAALDMGHIVGNALELLAHLIEEQQAEISVPDPAAWPVALGYAAWVEEVWLNYLSNAVKYGGRPPRVELGATVRPEDGMICFWVRDYGPGISPEYRRRLFTPFTQLNQVRAIGHGLGLSIVRLIVEKLNGQVGVESEGLPGRGAVFYFTLPAASPAAQRGEGSGY